MEASFVTKDYITALNIITVVCKKCPLDLTKAVSFSKEASFCFDSTQLQRRAVISRIVR